jgi:hypothetical protein
VFTHIANCAVIRFLVLSIHSTTTAGQPSEEFGDDEKEPMVEDAVSRKRNEDAASMKIEASIKVYREAVQEKSISESGKASHPSSVHTTSVGAISVSGIAASAASSQYDSGLLNADDDREIEHDIEAPIPLTEGVAPLPPRQSTRKSWKTNSRSVSSAT